MVLKRETIKNLPVGESAGVLWGGEYPAEYTQYEAQFPQAFPYTNRQEEHEKSRFVLGADGYWYDPTAKENGKAVICAAGDIICEPFTQRMYRFGSECFFQPVFRYVRETLRDSDFVIGNLETTVTDKTPYTDEKHLIGGKYHCNAPRAFLDALRYAGFDAVVTANNHCCDSGVAGLIDTLDALYAGGFINTGTFRPEDC